jgi:hypothetical protein
MIAGALALFALAGSAQEPAALQVAPARLSFLGNDRAERLPAQSVQVRNAGGGELVWHARATEAWVIVSPERAIAPATLLVAIDARVLSPGRHTARVIVEAAGARQSPQAIDVSVTISTTKPIGPPALQAVPESVSFSAPAGQTNALTFTVRVQAEQNAAMRWTAQADKPWLTVTPRQGTTPGELTLSASPASLTAGEHAASVSLIVGGAAAVLRIPVTFTVDAAGGRFGFTSTSLPAGVLNMPYSQPLPLRGGRPPYRLQLAGPLTPDLSLVNGVIRGVPRTAGTFAFTVIATDSAEPPSTVTETFTLPVVILDQNTILAVEPTEVRLAASGNRPPEAATVRVTSGGPPLTWRASCDATWVQIEPTSGTAPATFKVGAAKSGMKPGSYTATITVSMQGAPNSPAEIPVQLVVK